MSSQPDATADANAPAESVAAALSSAAFVRIVARADGDALAAAGLLARALRGVDIPFQIRVTSLGTDVSATSDDGLLVAVGSDPPEADVAIDADGPAASRRAYDVATTLVGEPGRVSGSNRDVDPVLTLAGTVAAGEHPDSVATSIVEAATDAIVVRLTELSGGEIGRVWRAGLDSGRAVAVKTGPAPLDVEARSLRVLADHGLPVPTVLAATEDVLVLEYVPGADWTPSIERALGRLTARLHDHTHEAYGWPEPTWKGRFEQPNPRTDDWPTFFGEHRLGYMADCAVEEGLLPGADAERIDALVDDLPALLDHDPEPSLIHGDVWTENLVTDGEAVRALLDPACYYADPEVELAYVDWTGTGGEAFFERYRERAAGPDGGLPDGVTERRPVYRLLPLLVHLRHFGAEYREPIRETLAELGY